MNDYYIGLMSGTSMDGVDAVVLDVATHTVLATHFLPFEQGLRADIMALSEGSKDSLSLMAILDAKLADVYALAVDGVLEKTKLSKQAIKAIGSHGQTLRHQLVDTPYAYTIQIGDPNRLAAKSGITVVADFRRADLARGGQGAPFAPIYHQQLFLNKTQVPTVVVNIGGIANVSYINKAGEPCGFDTGPGNTLLDAWTEKHLAKRYDHNGQWSTKGQCLPELLSSLLNDPYFSRLGPKSIGKEYFNLAWLEQKIAGKKYCPEDVQATLLALTVRSIREALFQNDVQCTELVVCGGGAKNGALLALLADCFERVLCSDSLGLDGDYIEAMMFAWLAHQALERNPVDTCSVTGAKHSAILGGVYYAQRCETC